MIGYIFFLLIMLATMFILNIKMDAKRVRPYELLVQVICTSGAALSIKSYAYNNPSQFSGLLFMLILSLFGCLHFLATYFIQYRKNREDIKTAQKTVTMAVVYFLLEICIVVFSIYLYYYFWYYGFTYKPVWMQLEPSTSGTLNFSKMSIK